jgi:glycosyltransferase 2 family protein
MATKTISSGKRRVIATVAVVASVGLVAWLLSRVDPGELARVAKTARPGWLVAAGLAVAALPPLMAWRWQAILVAQGAGRLPLPGLMRAVMAANILNTVLPGKAGDFVKAVHVRERSGLARGVGGVLLERIVDVGVLGALGLAGYAITGLAWGLWTGLGLLGGACAGVAAMRWLPVEKLVPVKKLRTVAADLRSTGHAWSARPLLVAQTVAGSLLVWTLCGTVLACLARAFDLPLSWGGACAVFPLSVMAGMVPLTLGGLGTRETVMVALLAGFMPREGATLLSLGYTVFTYWLLALISLPPAWGWLRAALAKDATPAPSGT